MRFYTPSELPFVIFPSLAPFAGKILIGLYPNILLVEATWALLTTVIMLFRIGRPEGFLAHCIRHIATPEDFRPGRVRTSEYEYPVAEQYENRKSQSDIISKILKNANLDV